MSNLSRNVTEKIRLILNCLVTSLSANSEHRPFVKNYLEGFKCDRYSAYKVGHNLREQIKVQTYRMISVSKYDCLAAV